MPNGQFLTAVEGGGIRGLDSAPIRTDAVRYGKWETFTLIDPGTVPDAPVAAPATPLAGPLPLPAVEGAWVVSFAESGGLAGGYTRYSINSAGEGLTSKRNGDVRRTVPPNALADVEKQIRAAQTQTWAGVNSPCDDCRRMSIDLSLRQAGGSVITHSVGWTLVPPSSPTNVHALVAAVESALSSAAAAK